LGSQNQPLILFGHIFRFSERKLDISNFAGKLLTVYNMVWCRLNISSSSSKKEKKSSEGALKIKVPKVPKIKGGMNPFLYYYLRKDAKAQRY
jgi:hypothetical protein